MIGKSGRGIITVAQTFSLHTRLIFSLDFCTQQAVNLMRSQSPGFRNEEEIHL